MLALALLKNDHIVLREAHSKTVFATIRLSDNSPLQYATLVFDAPLSTQILRRSAIIKNNDKIKGISTRSDRK
ncbi:hypothetical protein ES703_38948 [subsurface metagenome]